MLFLLPFCLVNFVPMTDLRTGINVPTSCICFFSMGKNTQGYPVPWILFGVGVFPFIPSRMWSPSVLWSQQWTSLGNGWRPCKSLKPCLGRNSNPTSSAWVFLKHFVYLPETNSWPMKITIFPGKYHQNGAYSIAMLLSGRVVCVLFPTFTPRLMGFANDHVDKQTRYVFASEANLRMLRTNESMYLLLNVGWYESSRHVSLEGMPLLDHHLWRCLKDFCPTIKQAKPRTKLRNVTFNPFLLVNLLLVETAKCSG